MATTPVRRAATGAILLSGVLTLSGVLGACSGGGSADTTVAETVAATEAPTTTVLQSRLSWPELGVGAKSDRVQVLQYLLSSNGIGITPDGNFGPKTKSAMQKFQEQHQVVASETSNADTWQLLATDVTATSPVDRIKALQVALTINGYDVPISGIFDEATRNFVQQSRADSGSTAAGDVTVNDWLTLVGIGD